MRSSILISITLLLLAAAGCASEKTKSGLATQSAAQTNRPAAPKEVEDWTEAEPNYYKFQRRWWWSYCDGNQAVQLRANADGSDYEEPIVEDCSQYANTRCWNPGERRNSVKSGVEHYSIMYAQCDLAVPADDINYGYWSGGDGVYREMYWYHSWCERNHGADNGIAHRSYWDWDLAQWVESSRDDCNRRSDLRCYSAGEYTVAWHGETRYVRIAGCETSPIAQDSGGGPG